MNYMPWLPAKGPTPITIFNRNIYNFILKSFCALKPCIVDKPTLSISRTRGKFAVINVYYNCIPFIDKDSDFTYLSPISENLPTLFINEKSFLKDLVKYSGKYVYNAILVTKLTSGTKKSFIYIIYDNKEEMIKDLTFFLSCFSISAHYDELDTNQRLKLIYQVRDLTTNIAYKKSNYRPDNILYSFKPKVKARDYLTKDEKNLKYRKMFEQYLIEQKEKEKEGKPNV